LTLVIATMTGCEALRVPWPKDPTGSQSPLKPINQAPGVVSLDVRFLHASRSDTRLNESLWLQADEQVFSPEIRKRLAAHGFRAGVIGGTLPLELQQLLDMDEAQTIEGDEHVLTEFEARPRVTHRQYSLRSGQKSEIQTSSVVPEMNLLLPTDGSLQGRTLYQVQGVMSVQVIPEPVRGHVRMSLVPELHFGPATTRWGHDAAGVLVMEPGRDRQGFPDLQLDVTLLPGQMILVSCDPNLPGSLADHMFSDRKTTPRRQTWLLIRIASDLRQENL
jgi:hypothetical protein